jgi:5-methylcytosine-specific restriction endonuclease McrA
VDNLSNRLQAPKSLDPGQRRIHPLLRFAVLNRDDFVCRYCGAEASEVDHATPWGRGGETLPFNLVASCQPCNRAKGERTPGEWRRDLAAERLRATRAPSRRAKAPSARPRRRRFSRSG